MTRERTHSGFTLIELLVVIAIISLLIMVVVPSIAALFRTGAITNGRNVVDAQLKATRGLAIRDRQYTGVRFQRGLDGAYWMGIVRCKDDLFDILQGTEMVTLPVGVGAGQVAEPFVDSSGNYVAANLGDFDAFTSFTVVFSPNGRLVDQVNGGNVLFKITGSLLFTATPQTWTKKQKTIWDAKYAVPAKGARALCLFEANELELFMPATGTGGDYTKVAEVLNDSARFLPVNPYTAGLIRTKGE